MSKIQSYKNPLVSVFLSCQVAFCTFCIIGIISLIFVGSAKALRKKMVELYPSEAESSGTMQDDRIPGKRMESSCTFCTKQIDIFATKKHL